MPPGNVRSPAIGTNNRPGQPSASPFREEWCRDEFKDIAEATFDCRVWQVPSWEEAANVLLWRQQDAIRNSILGLAQSQFSHASMQGQPCGVLIGRLLATETPWHGLPVVSQRGQFARRRKVFKELDAETLAKIPPDKRPNGPIERHEITTVELRPLANMDERVATLFGKAAAL